MLKSFKYKLYHSENNICLNTQVNIACYIYNHCIALKKKYYKLYKKNLPENDLKKHITKLKRTKKYVFWNKINSQTIQDIVERIEKGYKAFFKHHKQKRSGKKSLPSFKSKQRYHSITQWKICVSLLQC